jgi:Protein of unknown function (DUF2892)
MFPRMFPINQHPVERALRVLLGIGLLSLVFIGPRSPWGLVGIVPLLTGMFGSCPLYTMFGWNTCPIPNR